MSWAAVAISGAVAFMALGSNVRRLRACRHVHQKTKSTTPERPVTPTTHSPPPGGNHSTGRRPLKFLVNSIDRFAPAAKPQMLRLGTRMGYGLTNRRRAYASATCLNYGWATVGGDGIAPGGHLSAQEATSPDRYSLQLYERIAVPHVSGRQALEVGCGRGGGTTFLHDALGAQDVTGVDLTPSSVRWCTDHWSKPGVRFAVGDAESLDFDDASFDVVVNVESSHLYPSVEGFLVEVRRVLRRGGVLLIADFRSRQEMAELAQQIVDAGLVIEEEEDISANVVRALSLITPYRDAQIAKFALFSGRIAREFAGTEGTHFFRELTSGEIAYKRFVARKN